MLLDKLRKNYNNHPENSSTFYNTVPSKVNKIERSYWKEENFSYDYDPNKSDFIYTANYNNEIHAIIGKKDGSSPSKYVVMSSDGSTFIEKTAPPIGGYSYLIPYNNKLYLFCAYTTTFYILNNNSWVASGLVPYDFYGGAVYVYNNQIHVLGGNNNPQLHYAYSDSSKTWTGISDLSDYDDSGGKYYLENFTTQKVAVFNNSIWYFLRSNKEHDGYLNFVNYTAENKFKPKPYLEGSSWTGTPYNYNLLIVSNNILYWFANKNAGTLLPYYTDDIGKTNSFCFSSLGDKRNKSIHLEDALDYNNKMHGFSFNSDTNKIKRYTFNSGAVDPSVKYNFEAALVEYKEINSLDFILPIDSVIYTNADVTGNVIQTGNSYTVKTDNQTIKIINGYEDNVYISIYSNDDFLLYSKPAITIPESQTKQYYFIQGTIVNDVPITTEGLTEIELPAVITYKNIPEHDHAFIDTGSNHVCSICGLSEEHTFSEDFTVDTEPTCSNTGSKSNHCTKCTAKTNVTEIPVVPHNYASAVTKEAACEEEGITTFTCSSCGHSYEETIKALGHDYSTEFTIDIQPTCNSVGSKSKHCSRCDAKTEVTEISITEHNYVGTITKQATCIEEGARTYTCSKCGSSYKEKIPALGHNYVNGTCTNCGTHLKHLSDKNVGDIVKIEENGRLEDFIIVHKGNPSPSIYDTSCTGIWLLRRHCFNALKVENTIDWVDEWVSENGGNPCLYTKTIIHLWLNSTYLKAFQPSFSSKIKTVKIPYNSSPDMVETKDGTNGLETKCFLLSYAELGGELDTTTNTNYVYTREGSKLTFFDKTDKTSDEFECYLNGYHYNDKDPSEYERSYWHLRSGHFAGKYMFSPAYVMKGSSSAKMTVGYNFSFASCGCRPAFIVPDTIYISDNNEVLG